MPSTPLDPQTVIETDGYLKDEVGAIVHRHDIFRKWKDSIEQHEGGYDNFSKGYLKFGLNVKEDGTVTYREWAPNALKANLIGDFSAHSLCFTMRSHSLTWLSLQTAGTGIPIRWTETNTECG